MNEKTLEQLKKSTRLFASLIKQDIETIKKLEIVEQIRSNLKELKDLMEKTDFEKEFGKLNESAEKVFANITDKNFIDSIVDKLQSILSSLGLSSGK
jgi:glutamine synthetase type III